MQLPIAHAPSRLTAGPGRPFHIMVKPVGPICNLDCKYCFYLEKEKLYPEGHSFRMSDAVLEQYVRQYIADQRAPEITFGWQGGEPTLMGIDFFRKAVALQKQFAAGKTIHNTIQTNATLLDDEWCQFLAENHFLVGVSIDGPADLHDFYRVDKKQKPTFDTVMRGIELLKKHGVEFNTLTVVNRHNSQHPLKVYRFLKEIGSRFLQFIPLVERKVDGEAKSLGLDLAAPPVLEKTRHPESLASPSTRDGKAGETPALPGSAGVSAASSKQGIGSDPRELGGRRDPLHQGSLVAVAPRDDEPAPNGDSHVNTSSDQAASPVTDWSVESHQYGQFLVEIFEEWVVRDVGTVFVQLFDVALGNWMELGSGMCVFAERCGVALAMEHDGDVFSCDHYVYPRYKLGNLLHESLGDMVNSPAQFKFGNDKSDTLPKYCRNCEVRFACHGECPKHRFISTPDGEAGLNYLCAGYKRFFNHIDPYMKAMSQLLDAGRPATDIMGLIAQHEQSDAWDSVKPADACPCGSGKVYSACCLARRKTTD